MIKLARDEVFLVGRGALVIGGIILALALVGFFAVLNWIASFSEGAALSLLATVLFLALLGGVRRLTRKIHL